VIHTRHTPAIEPTAQINKIEYLLDTLVRQISLLIYRIITPDNLNQIKETRRKLDYRANSQLSILPISPVSNH